MQGKASEQYGRTGAGPQTVGGRQVWPGHVTASGRQEPLDSKIASRESSRERDEKREPRSLMGTQHGGIQLPNVCSSLIKFLACTLRAHQHNTSKCKSTHQCSKSPSPLLAKKPCNRGTCWPLLEYE